MYAWSTYLRYTSITTQPSISDVYLPCMHASHPCTRSCYLMHNTQRWYAYQTQPSSKGCLCCMRDILMHIGNMSNRTPHAPMRIITHSIKQPRHTLYACETFLRRMVIIRRSLADELITDAVSSGTASCNNEFPMNIYIYTYMHILI
jgi:hypothetical protein